MPILEENPRFGGISLPPGGWVLTTLLVIYIFTGLIGHDPWKHDDAIAIGIAHDIVRNGNWLIPQLAGRVYPDAPLYYWFAAATGRLFSWLMPFHDAARLASGVLTLLSLEFILLAARESYGRPHAAAAPLILAGCIGFLIHAHEAQPMLLALTAHTAAYWALALWPRHPRRAIAILAAALATAFLANGLLPIITLLPALGLTLWSSENRRRCLGGLLAGIAVAAIPCGVWLFVVHVLSPGYLADFFRAEWAVLAQPVNPPKNALRYANLLLWYAWPALPLAGGTLWYKRRELGAWAIAFPACSFFAVLVLLILLTSMRSATLLLLPPLVLLATAGVGALRRGAANAFDWFGMVSFTFFAGIVWIGWSALVFGWPERLARQAVRLEPGFSTTFSAFPFLFALICTGFWFWMIVTSPRSPMRGITHWMVGLTLFWLLLANLWMSWIDYGKTFRGVSASLKEALPAQIDCVADAGLPLSLLASLDYFDDIRTVPRRSERAAACSWLLVQGDRHIPADLVEAGWRPVWRGNRPSDRRADDAFYLYHRGRRAGPASELGEFVPADPEPDPTVPSRAREARGL
ncbi:MAG: glycosyltransferase family 39 protein [Candidatus Accumulibacter sp.]|jgi:4-amino-4-deoxy-L-arabinose transferase-like glycosyltransferase|nr:glycosyltransferase family 39 protein [Accumulibacter sp.]